MGELYNPFPKLPKNIRQIGERDQSVRLYLEDYVNTYLKRLYPKGGQDLRVGVLLGTVQERDGTPYLFVDGALEMEDVTDRGEKVVFTENAWKKTYQVMEKMFPRRVIAGWFLCGAPGSTLSPLNYWKQHGQYFAGKNQIMYLNSGLDGEEAVYVASGDGFCRLRGYCIYYERNQMMQDYMITRKDVRRVESGTGDTVIKDFRQRMEENKTQVTARKSTVRVLGSLCAALGVLVLAGGVAMLNNYEKMKDMEAVLSSVLPAGNFYEDEADRPGGTGTVVVEEAEGGLDLTVGSAETEGQQAGDGDPFSAQEGNADVQETGQYIESGSGQEPADTQADPQESREGAEQQEAAALRVQAGQTVYEVQEGDTLFGICLDFYGDGTKMEEICSLNGLEDENKITAGQNLILP